MRRIETYGTDPFTERITIGTSDVDLRFGVDCRGVNIYNEGPNDLTMTGLDWGGTPIAAGIVDLTDTPIVDNLDGTVTLETLIDHEFAVGSDVTIQGRSSSAYNGVFEVESGSATDQLIITAPWVVDLTTTPGVDNGDGTVTLETDGDHYFLVGTTITIADRTDDAYAGSQVVAAGSATDQLIITDTYVDESAGVAAGGTATGIYDETAGVDVAGDVLGVHSSILPATAAKSLPIGREARSKFLRVVSAGTSVLSIDGVR